MQEQNLTSRSIKSNSVHSKILFGGFSPIKKSQLDIKKNEAFDQLYCEFCTKIFTLTEFREHLNQHRRKPQPQILPLNELYNHIELKSRFNETNQLEVKRVESVLLNDHKDYNEFLADKAIQNLVFSSKSPIVKKPEAENIDFQAQTENRRISLPVRTNQSSNDTSEKLSLFYQRQIRQAKKNHLVNPIQTSKRDSDTMNTDEFVFYIDKNQKRPASKGKNLMIHLQPNK